jgi:addiction module RelE/StbE family toxin
MRILKKWQKKHTELIQVLENKLNLFTENPFHPALKTHRLSGNLKDYWALYVTYEYRLIFKFLSESKVLLIDLGTHDEVY